MRWFRVVQLSYKPVMFREGKNMSFFFLRTRWRRVGGRDMATLILTVYSRWSSALNFAPLPIYICVKEPSLVTAWGALWAQQPVWTFRRRDKCIVCVGIRTQNYPAHSLIIYLENPRWLFQKLLGRTTGIYTSFAINFVEHLWSDVLFLWAKWITVLCEACIRTF